MALSLRALSTFWAVKLSSKQARHLSTVRFFSKMAHFVDSKKWVLILPSTFNPVIFFFWAVHPSGGKIYKALKFPFQNVQFPYSKYVCTVVKPQLAAMFRPSHHLKLNLFSPLVITPTPQFLTSWLPGICYFFLSQTQHCLSSVFWFF